MFERQKVRRHDYFRKEWSQLKEQMQVPNGRGPGVRRSKRPLSASRTRRNAPRKPPKFAQSCVISVMRTTH